MKRISVIDSHTGGEPTRVVLEGVSEAELDGCHRALLTEPRGHEVLVGALLSSPQDATCHTRVTFFNNVGRLGMCGHGLIGVIATLRHLGRLDAGTHRIETPVGIVTATLEPSGRVCLQNVPSYRLAQDVQIGNLRGDVAWGGNWFFLTQAPHDLALTRSNAAELTRICLALREGVHAAGYHQVDHIELFSAPHDATNHSRNFVLCPGDEYDRSPCGTGTSAKLACLAAEGVLSAGTVWRQESVIGSVFEAWYVPSDHGILPILAGQAFVTAETTLLFDPRDPFAQGLP